MLQIQSSHIQIEEQFGYVWIYHTINSSHMQTNTAAVPQASRQHGFVDDTQLVAMISSCSLLAGLFNVLPLEEATKGVYGQACNALKCCRWAWTWASMGNLFCPAFAAQHLGTSFSESTKHPFFWKLANAEMSQIGQPREQLVLSGFVSHVLLFFSFKLGNTDRGKACHACQGNANGIKRKTA